MRAFVFYSTHFKWRYLLVLAENVDEAWDAVAEKEPKWTVDQLKNACKIKANLALPSAGNTVAVEVQPTC